MFTASLGDPILQPLATSEDERAPFHRIDSTIEEEAGSWSSRPVVRNQDEDRQAHCPSDGGWQDHIERVILTHHHPVEHPVVVEVDPTGAQNSNPPGYIRHGGAQGSESQVDQHGPPRRSV